MPEINNSLALGIKNDPIDIGKTLLTAGQINALRTKSALEEASTAQTQQQTQYNQFQQDQNAGYRVTDVNTLAEAHQKQLGIAGSIGGAMKLDASPAGRRQHLQMAKDAGSPASPKTERQLLTMSDKDYKAHGERMEAAGRPAQSPGIIDPAGAASANATERGKNAGILGVQTPPPISASSPTLQPRADGEPIRTNPDGTIAGNVATYGQPGSLSSSAAEVGAKSGMAKDALEQSQKSYNSAMDLKARIPDIAHDIEVLGPSWMGAGAEQKTAFAKGWNGLVDTAAGILGAKPNANMQFDPKKVATAEEFAKEQTRAGMALLNSNFGAGREAASIVQMGRAAVAGQGNTYLGAKYVLATIEAVADRQAALHEFKMTDNGPLATAEIRFNKQHPPQEFTYQSIAKNLPPAAISELRANPKLAPKFDEAFKVPGLGKYLASGTL